MPARRTVRTGLLFAVLLMTVSCARGPDAGDLAGWNVLLVTIDTLRGDRLGFSGYEFADTPNLDRVAEHGVVFENAIATAPVTLPSHASILTGRYPPAHGALDNGYYSLPDDVPTLAGTLRENEYETAAFIGAVVLHARYGLDSGFDLYDDDIRKPREQGQAYRERRAPEVTELVTNWLGQRTSAKPFFVWAHYWDPHAPYFPPEPFASRFRTRPYDGEIAAVDESLGNLFGFLEETGELDRTIIVIVADHGEAFGEAGELTHGMLLRGATLRIPLVISARGRLPAGRRVAGVVSNADVTPTILDLLGLGIGVVDGQSLVGAIREGHSGERYAYSETRLPVDEYGWSMLAGVRSEDWAWVRAPRPELYDLREDSGETRTLHEENPAVVSRMDAVVEAVLENRRATETRDELDPGQLESLRALGYVFSRETPTRTGVDPKDMMEILQEANRIANYLDRGESEKVVSSSLALLEKDPGNREVLFLMAQALDRLGRTEEAIEPARKAFDSGGVLDLHGTLLAMYLAKLERFDESAALLRSFAEAEPDYAEHPFNLGNLLTQAGRHEEARRAFARALELNPDAVHILANYSLSLSRAGDGSAERALELIDHAIEIAVDDDVPSLLKMQVCKNLGMTELGMEIARSLQRRPLRKVTSQALADAIRSLQEG